MLVAELLMPKPGESAMTALAVILVMAAAAPLLAVSLAVKSASCGPSVISDHGTLSVRN